MARYTRESRERVRDAVDFAEIVGARTELKRSGVNRLQGLCPFHEERTPSFGIDPVEKLYYCFGCSAGGDVFSFVMETEGLDFASALEWLAERYRVPLEREAEDPREAEQRQARERLLALLERTAAWYVRLLWESDEAAPAREYLGSRGLEEGALREYRVGWAPDAWDRVVAASSRAGFSAAELLAAGLAQRRRDGSGLVDRFRGRITFPLADVRGHVLGFGARAMKAGDTPKYLNTSESELFHKSRLVYGADLARAAAAKAGRVVLVEGYTDVIALRQAGVPETVASMGTALTDAQVDAIARLAPRALFCQDPDTAGQESVARGIAGLRQHNQSRSTTSVEFRIVRLPPGQDPADVVQREGADAMRERIEAAVPIERFEVERALELGDLASPDGRDAVLRQVAGIIAPLPASVLRADLTQLVASRLQLGENLINEVLASALRGDALAGAPREGAWERDGGPSQRGGGWPQRGERFRPGGPRRGGRWDARRGRGFDAPPPPEPVDPHAALARREQSERAFLALCLALPEEGERRLAEADLDDYFFAPATREAAAYLRGRLRRPASELPAGNEALARLVAELVIRSGNLEATPAKLELEALQMDLQRLERQMSTARLSGGSGVQALAAERQRVLDAIRHKLT
ncbi:DNA primase [Candidatus Solirubrobacter pratensis]|uniref:DNA primase n=1 Tax=Candidatus Solirubrobacter pratensis TaxID=1298857 RepID=UPI000408A4A5|nr:DNA primase [Candidatus Solirubrobacter pratensis]